MVVVKPLVVKGAGCCEVVAKMGDTPMEPGFSKSESMPKALYRQHPDQLSK